MNYQRSCKNNSCYAGSANIQRTAPKYQPGTSSIAVRTSGASQSDLKLPIATSLAMVYSPMQLWRDIYDTECALERGTLFAELDKPLLSSGK